MGKRSDKRERLIAAAKQLIHQQGYNETTLADIAQLADVPLGNVYYYFKTKDAIGEAVLVDRARELQVQFEQLNTLPGAKDRLTSIINEGIQAISETIRYGDAIGSLCQELSKQGGKLADDASGLMKDILSWMEIQFNSLGKSDNSANLALQLLAGIQGNALLATTFKDEEMTAKQQQTLLTWLETV